MNTARFRFHAELNDFLPPEQRGRIVVHPFQGRPGIKDPIEAIGVPHPEITLIVVNDRSVGFEYQLNNGDHVFVYPNSLDHASSIRLRDDLPPRIAFIVDVNLGKLARRLRLCGFDSKYHNDFTDRDVAGASAEENRIVLTRDRRLLHHKTIVHGYWVRNTDPDAQLVEVLKRFGLDQRIHPFHRCIDCNGVIQSVSKDRVLGQLEPLTKQYYQEFYRCLDCGKVYWKGSHYEHMLSHLSQIFSDDPSRETAPGA